ncbi:hypothetical protein [Microcoleus anatoxicus]|uniref:hypothetical protein n=1 Tax=Microcoleus anatoxicus TaxID=2705319 RepID=UPI0030C9C056
MSNLTNPPGGADLPDRFRNVGEQIQAFFDFAENNPDRAVPFFVNIWETQASLTTRALALQGLGVAAKHYRVKEAFADWDVLKDIAKEVKGKGEVSNDLTRWAAASALEAIGYSQQSLQHLEGGGFTEPLDRIRREIRDRKLTEINRIQRLNSRGEPTAEYERHLEFWIYGPADELLNDRDRSLNYQDLVGDVISKLHGRGVYLGLISPNSIVQGAALRQAGLIFKESAEIEKYLYGLLEEFLHNSSHETPLRIHAAEIINTAGDLSRKLKTLSKLLLEETELRNRTVRLLTPDKQQLARIESDAYTVLETLNFEYRLDKPEPKDLIISQIEQIITSSNQAIDVILARLETAIEAAENLARQYNKSSNLLVNFLKSKQDAYLSNIHNWIQTLRSQVAQLLDIHKKISENQSFLKQILSEIYPLDSQLYKKVSEIPNLAALDNQEYKNYSYHRCQSLKNILTQIQEGIKLCVNNQKLKIKQEKSLKEFIINCIVCFIFLLVSSFLFLLVAFIIMGGSNGTDIPLSLILTSVVSLILLIVCVSYRYYWTHIRPNKFEPILQQLSNWQI